MKKGLRLATAAVCLQIFVSGAIAAAGSAAVPSLAPPPPAAPRQGAAEVTGHPDPLALLDDGDPVLAANKRLVFDMWRSVVNAGQVELADAMLREDYIQHSPVLPTGRAAFKQIFSAIERRAVPELVSPPLVTILAEGDLVVMALREELPDPQGSGRYTSTHFNLFRVEDEQLAEHWHSVQAVPGPEVLPPSQGGPQPVTGASGTAQFDLLQAADPVLAANKRLVFDAWRQMLDAGREELADIYVANDYIEHDPNGQSGRAGFKAHVAAREDTPIALSIEAPLVAMVAQGDLVVLVTGQVHPHPSRPGESYTTTHFNLFRIENSLVVEHWNGALKPGGAPGPYGG